MKKTAQAISPRIDPYTGAAKTKNGKTTHSVTATYRGTAGTSVDLYDDSEIDFEPVVYLGNERISGPTYTPASDGDFTVNIYLPTDVIPTEFFMTQDLKSFTLRGITEIGEEAFSGCVDLDDISIRGVSIIGDYAFNNAEAPGNVTFDGALTHIGNRALNMTPQVSKPLTFYFSSTTPPTLGDSVFPDGEFTIKVPAALGAAYVAAWSDYEEQIVWEQ